MSFSRIPNDVLIHCLAPFFIFEHSCDPAREDQAQDGRHLLLLRRWSGEQTALIKRKMTRVSADDEQIYCGGRTSARRIERSAREVVILMDNRRHKTCFELMRDWWFGNNPYRWIVVDRRTLSPDRVHAWDEKQQKWEEKPHPILSLAQWDWWEGRYYR